MATLTKTEVKLEPSKLLFTPLRLQHKPGTKPKKNKNLNPRSNNTHDDTLETDSFSFSGPIPAMDKDFAKQSDNSHSSTTDNKVEANTALSPVDSEGSTTTATEDNVGANTAVSPIKSEGLTKENIKANTAQGDSEGTSSTINDEVQANTAVAQGDSEKSTNTITDDKVAANIAEAEGHSEGSTCTTTEDSTKANTVVAQGDSETSPSTTTKDNVAQSDSEGSPSTTTKDTIHTNTAVAQGDLGLTSTLCNFSQDSSAKLPVPQPLTTKDEIKSTAAENHKAMKSAKKAKCFRKCSLNNKFKTEDLFCTKIQLTTHQSSSHSGQNSSPTLGLGAVPKPAATVEDPQKLQINETPMLHPCDAGSVTSTKTGIVKQQDANMLQIASVDKCTKRCGDLRNQQITSISKVLETTCEDEHMKVCGDSSQVNKKDPVVPTANSLGLFSTNTPELDGATASPNTTTDKDRQPKNDDDKMKLQLTQEPTCSQHAERPASVTGVNISSPIQHNHQATPNSSNQQRPETEDNTLESLGRSVSTDGPSTSGQQDSSAQSENNRNGMSDFIIVNTEADNEAATLYAEHLMRDIPVDNLTVDLLHQTGGGQTKLGILKTLHNSHRYILIYVTENFASDPYERFRSEVLITLGLKNATAKKDRIVPVFPTQTDYDILELSTIIGLKYFNYLNHSAFLKQSYVRSVQTLVQDGRKRFP